MEVPCRWCRCRHSPECSEKTLVRDVKTGYTGNKFLVIMMTLGQEIGKRIVGGLTAAQVFSLMNA